MTSEPLLRSRRPRWRWLVAIAVIACLAAVWLLRTDLPLVLMTFPDGEQLTYRAAGVGWLKHTEHSKAYEWCYGKLARYGPPGLIRRLPVPRVTLVSNVQSRTGAQSLILFFERQPRSQPQARRRPFHELVKIEIEDADGHRFPGEPGSIVVYPDGRELFSFDSYPRRERMLVIHVTALADPSKTARFEIKNPAIHTGFPDWTPQQLPQTKSDRAMDVTLGELDAESILEGKELPVEFTIRDPAWERHVVASWLEDPTGNHGHALSPFETAWKARVTIARTDPSTLLPADKWTLGPFPLPTTGATTSIRQLHESNGVRFTVQHLHSGRTIAATGPPLPPGRGVTTTLPANGKWTFRIDVTGPTSGFYLIARVEDQSGQQLTQLGQSVQTRGRTSKSAHGVTFTPKPDTTHVTLTLMASAPKEFDFFVAPPSELKTRSAMGPAAR